MQSSTLHTNFDKLCPKLQSRSGIETNFVLNSIVGDMKGLSCEPRGIPLKGLQIACVVTIYFDYVICKSA